MAKLLQDYVTRQAERNPENTALVLKEERLTYGQLEKQSNQLARMLRELGCQKGDRVCLLMPRSPAAIVGLMGIYKADAIYVPLDRSTPAPRLARIIDSCDPSWILAAGPVAPLLDEIGRITDVPFAVGWLGDEREEGETFRAEFSWTDLLGYPAVPRCSRNTAQDTAHILFTSGSTGVPKGVMIAHANVIHFIEWAKAYFGMDASDRLSGHFPLHFDLSMFDIFCAFGAGAELHLVPAEINVLPNQLAKFIGEAGLTQWFSVPSALNHMAKFDVVRCNDFPALRRLLWCGEVLPTPALIYWMTRLPHVRFTNLYGPTEAAIASSYYTVAKCPEDERKLIPIGTPCAGEELLVLDEELEPLPPGKAGDLYIRGVGLSPGYWRDPEKTREVFLPNPRGPDPSDRIYKTGDLAKIGEDGLVYFLGRRDTQIKSRGYRIELGEIEAALNAVDGLQESAVVAVPTNGFEGIRICCAYVPLPNHDLTPQTLREALSMVLPGYMLPSAWMPFRSLPKNGNGKVDRPRLVEEFKYNEPSKHRQRGDDRPGGRMAEKESLR